MRFPTKPVGARRAAQQMMTEEQLGENIRDACKQLGWHFLWCRKLQHSSKGILDLMLIPIRPYRAKVQGDAANTLYRRRVLHRELKGHDARGRLGTATDEQVETMTLLNATNSDAALWTPEDWFSGKILEELR